MPPLWQDITNELGISTEDLNYGYATAYGSLTIACVLFIPLSVTFGRRPVYLATSLIMIASAAWMGCLQTTADVLGSNFMSGIAGAVNEALFNVTVRTLIQLLGYELMSRKICDLFFVHQRGTMTGIYLMVVILGVSVIVDGEVAELTVDNNFLDISCSCCSWLHCRISRLAMGLLVLHHSHGCYICGHASGIGGNKVRAEHDPWTAHRWISRSRPEPA